MNFSSKMTYAHILSFIGFMMVCLSFWYEGLYWIGFGVTIVGMFRIGVLYFGHETLFENLKLAYYNYVKSEVSNNVISDASLQFVVDDDDFASIKEGVKLDLKDSKIEKAFEKMNKFLNKTDQPELQNKLSLLQSRYNSVKIKLREGTISNDNFDISKNQITKSFFEFIQDIQIVSKHSMPSR